MIHQIDTRVELWLMAHPSGENFLTQPIDDTVIITLTELKGGYSDHQRVRGVDDQGVRYAKNWDATSVPSIWWAKECDSGKWVDALLAMNFALMSNPTSDLNFKDPQERSIEFVGDSDFCQRHRRYFYPGGQCTMCGASKS